MRSMVLVIAVLFSSLVMSAQSDTHIVMHQDGLFALATVFANGNGVGIQVSRAKDSTGQPVTFIFFDISTQTADGFTDSFGFGTIPSDSFKGDDPAHVVLDVDTSQLTTVSITVCNFNFIDSTHTCGPAPGGLIHLEWRQTKSFVDRTVNDTQLISAQSQINFHEIADSASAAVTGSLLGLDMSNASGTAGMNHSSELELFLTH